MPKAARNRSLIFHCGWSSSFSDSGARSFEWTLAENDLDVVVSSRSNTTVEDLRSFDQSCENHQNNRRHRRPRQRSHRKRYRPLKAKLEIRADIQKSKIEIVKTEVETKVEKASFALMVSQKPKVIIPENPLACSQIRFAHVSPVTRRPTTRYTVPYIKQALDMAKKTDETLISWCIRPRCLRFHVDRRRRVTSLRRQFANSSRKCLENRLRVHKNPDLIKFGGLRPLWTMFESKQPFSIDNNHNSYPLPPCALVA